MRIAQPWTHIFCHPHSSVTLWNEQLPHSPPPAHTLVTHQPPCERPHTQHYQLLAEMHFFIWPRRDEQFQPCPQTSPGFLCEFSPRMDGLLCSQLTYMHSTTPLPQRMIIGTHVDVAIYLLLC